MVDVDNQTQSAIDTTFIEEIAAFLSPRDVELLLVNDEKIHALNLEYRGVDSPTDVLSFPLVAPLELGGEVQIPLGSIVICVDKVQQEARNRGHEERFETALLFIHGMLHLLGYDHERDNGEQRAKEREVIERFGLPLSLIERNERVDNA